MRNISKKNKSISLKYIFTESVEKLSKAYDLLFEETAKNKEQKHNSSSERVLAPDEFSNLYDYYKIQYPKDLEIFKNACPTDKYSDEHIFLFVKDLQYLKETNHFLLKKKHFVYFLAIHTAFLMTVHKYFNEKYNEFKIKNKGLVFEFGLTLTYIYPWEILDGLSVSFEKKLFSECLGWVISEMMVDYHFCGIIPRDFMDKFIDDPDLNNPKTVYGKEWKEIALEEWFQATRCICHKIK